MFDTSNRYFTVPTILDLRSVFMAILWLSLLVVVFHCFRKRTKLVQNFGILTVVMLLVLILVRAFAPFNFSFTLNISSTFLGDVAYFCTTPISGLPFSVTPRGILLAVWLGGIVISLLRFVYRSRKVLKAFREDQHNPSQEDLAVFLQVQDEMGKTRRAVLQRAAVMVPMTYGYFRPTILLPTGRCYTRQELYCIFLHELTHFYHRDAWIKLLVQILCSCLWWNPLVYLFQKDVEQMVELHCDAAVYARLNPIKQCDYLETLANEIKATQNVHRLAEVLAGASQFANETGNDRMEQRFQLLAKASETPKRTKWYYLLVSLILLAVLFLSYLFSFHPLHTQYGTLEAMTSGIPVTQETSYLVQYPKDCYFLVVSASSDSEEAIYALVPLDDPNMVQEALEVRRLEVRTVDKAGFLKALAQTGSEDPEADYIFWAYLYFPDQLTQEEKAAFSMSEEERLQIG